MNRRVVVATDEVLELELGVPSGHRHLRAVLRLRDGSELVLQEATLAALARAYVTVKTDPVRSRLRLTGRVLKEEERRDGFAVWQLLESEQD